MVTEQSFWAHFSNWLRFIHSSLLHPFYCCWVSTRAALLSQYFMVAPTESGMRALSPPSRSITHRYNSQFPSQLSITYF